MRLEKFRHACLLIEEGQARLLLDPGSFSEGFEDLTDLTAILITHQHPDHLDLDRIKPLLAQNPDAQVIADQASSEQFLEAGLEARAVREGDELEVGGVPVQVLGSEHAVLHPELPVPPNVGYFIADRFFYPGDAFTDPGRGVEILGLPAAAPWLKVQEAIDYLRHVKPRVAVPMHEAVLAMPELHYRHLRRFGDQQGTELRILDDGRAATF